MDMVMELPTEYMDSSQVYLSAFSVWVVTETLFALFCRIIFGLMTLTCDLLSLNKLFLLSFSLNGEYRNDRIIWDNLSSPPFLLVMHIQS